MTGELTFAVPDGESPAASCPYCDRPFPTDQLRALHVGEVHGDVMSSANRADAEAAREDEADELFILHLKVIAGLVLVTMGFSYLYAFVWS